MPSWVLLLVVFAVWCLWIVAAAARAQLRIHVVAYPKGNEVA